MAEKQMVPEVRFAGFEGEWEKKRFGKCVLIQRGGSPRPIEAYITDDPEGINWIKIGDVAVGSRYITSTKERIRPEGAKYSRRVFKGDLILSNSMSFGRPYIMQIGGCIHDGWLLVRDENSIFDIEYLVQLLSSNFMLNQYKTLASGGVVNNLNSELVQSTTVSVPSYKEQKRTGAFFMHLDNLIAAQQRKVDKLAVVKKAMLEKMFPKDGASVPEIRFTGFSEAWGTQKLGETSDIKTGPFGSALHAGDYVDNGVPIITTEHFKDGRLPEEKNGIPQVSHTDFLRLVAYRLEESDIVFSRVGSVDINALVYIKQKGWLFSGRVLRVRSREKYSSQFLHYALETVQVKKDILFRAVGQTMPSINTEILKDTSVNSPDSLDEQSTIGTYFHTLDRLTTLQTQKLTKLKTIKQALLAKMFV